MPHLTYIGQAPTEGTGSPVILLRHLQRFSKSGWKISIFAERGQDVSACVQAGWTVHTLPLRRKWWPPYREDRPLSRFARTWLLARECLRAQRNQQPDAILGYLAAHSDFYPEIAAHLAHQSRVPLTLLIHDDAAAFPGNAAGKSRQRKRHDWILRQARRRCFVSPELADAYDAPAAGRYVLPPIPEGWSGKAGWQDEFAVKPRVYYAGYIWPAQFSLLGKIARILDSNGVRLTLLTRETPELKTFLADAPADHIPPFGTNREALAHLSRSAAGILVAYTESVAQMPWISTSFPSKLIEYLHLGLPSAIVAPTESSVGKWAARSAYPDFFSPEQLESIAIWAADLRDAGKWKARAAASKNLAHEQFSPEKIHAMLESQLLAA